MKNNEETKIQKEITDRLDLSGLAYRRDRNQRIQATAEGIRHLEVEVPGWPDLVVILPNGRHEYVEVKAPGKKQSPEQVQIMIDLLANNCGYTLAYSVADIGFIFVKQRELETQGLKGQRFRSKEISAKRKQNKFHKNKVGKTTSREEFRSWIKKPVA